MEYLIGHLERMLLTGEITEDEYRERKEAYVDFIIKLYLKGYIDKKEMRERLDQ